MADYQIVEICTRCNGTGSATSEAGGRTTCSDCGGDGIIEYRTLKDLKNDIDDIKDKLDDILKKLKKLNK